MDTMGISGIIVSHDPSELWIYSKFLNQEICLRKQYSVLLQ